MKRWTVIGTPYLSAMHSPPEDGEIRESRRGNRKKNVDVTPNLSYLSGGRKNGSSGIKRTSSVSQDFSAAKGRSYKGDNLRNYYSTPAAANANRKIFSSSQSQISQRSSKHRNKRGVNTDVDFSKDPQNNVDGKAKLNNSRTGNTHRRFNQHGTKSKKRLSTDTVSGISGENIDGVKSARKKRKRGRNVKGKKARYKGLKVKTKRFRFRRRIPSDGGEGENMVLRGSLNKYERSFRASTRGRRWVSRSPPRRLFRRNRREQRSKKIKPSFDASSSATTNYKQNNNNIGRKRRGARRKKSNAPGHDNSGVVHSNTHNTQRRGFRKGGKVMHPTNLHYNLADGEITTQELPGLGRSSTPTLLLPISAPSDSQSSLYIPSADGIIKGRSDSLVLGGDGQAVNSPRWNSLLLTQSSQDPSMSQNTCDTSFDFHTNKGNTAVLSNAQGSSTAEEFLPPPNYQANVATRHPTNQNLGGVDYVSATGTYDYNGYNNAIPPYFAQKGYPQYHPVAQAEDVQGSQTHASSGNAPVLEPASQGHAQGLVDENAGNVSSGSEKEDSSGDFEGEEGDLIIKSLGEGNKRLYTILSELGVGTFGRVLECIEKSDAKGGKQHVTMEENHVAIKVVRKVKRYTKSAKIEADILSNLNHIEHSSNTRAPKPFMYVIQLVDSFIFNSHMCLVFEACGPNLYYFMKRNRRRGVFGYRPNHVKFILFQLLNAISFLHNECNIVHTDLKLENILFVSDEYYEFPVDSETVRLVPKSLQIKLIDFGSAAYEDEHHSSIINTRQYRAPEVVLGLGWSFPSDVWGVGCMAMEMLKGSLLFETHDSYEHLALMEKLCGKFPDHMILGNKEAISRGTGRNEVHDFFVETDSKTNDESESKFRCLYPIEGRHDEESIQHVESRKTLRQQCKKCIPDDEKMVNGLVELCTMMLQLDPAKRATAAECLNVEYFSELNAMPLEEIVAHATSLSFVYGEITDEEDEAEVATGEATEHGGDGESK